MAHPPAAAPVVVPVPFDPADAPPDDSFGDILSQFEQTQQVHGKGSQVTGTVVSITDEWVFVDLGRKNDGVVPAEKFRNTAGEMTARKGAQLSLTITSRDEHGIYLLDTLHAPPPPKDWTALEDAFSENRIIRAKVVEAVKGGLRVDVGMRGFLPASRSGTRNESEMMALIGQDIECRITKLDKEKDDIVVDRRGLIEERANASKQEIFASLSEGAIVSGPVRSLTDYGAFVDLGGIDGLLHVADISWNRVGKPGDLLTVGDVVQVKILKISRETQKVSLGMKQLKPEPWSQVGEKYHVGTRIKGSVVRLTDFGAFVELEPGIDGMVHVSEMSWTKKIRKPADALTVGETVEVQILQVNPADKRIALGLRQVMGDPWAVMDQKYPIGSSVEGKVVSLQKFGAFIDISEGVEGMIHVGDITHEKRLEHPSDALKVGQVVTAQVLEIDKERRRLRLGMKQLLPTRTDDFIGEHKVGDTVTGRVADVHDGRAKVDLGEGVFAQCRWASKKAASPEAAKSGGSSADVSSLSAMLAQRWKQGAGGPAADDSPRAGQVRSFRITALDPAAKKIDVELV
ncbi:MAG: 30S ribosomal protein S1 [Bryobacteraceae bacterium]|nr:30S ribosomal protein S1 [Bryobacteraceae bacterium]